MKWNSNQELLDRYIAYLKAMDDWVTKPALELLAEQHGYSMEDIYQTLRRLKEIENIGNVWLTGIRREVYRYYEPSFDAEFRQKAIDSFV